MSSKIFFISIMMFVMYSVGIGQTWRDSVKKIQSPVSQLDYLYEQFYYVVYSNPLAAEPMISAFDSLSSKFSDVRYTGISKMFEADILFMTSKQDEALPIYISALEELETTEHIDLQAKLLNNIASCYQIRNDIKTSTSYFEQSLEHFEQLGDTLWIANVNSNLGLQYFNDGYYDKSEEYFDAAIANFNLIDNTIGNGISHLNRGNLRIEQARVDEAIDDFNIARSLIPEELSPLFNSAYNIGMGTALFKNRNTKGALDHLILGLRDAKKNGLSEQMQKGNEQLSVLYKSMGNYKKSLEHYEEYVEMKDSMFTIEQDGKLADALTKYDTEKKETEIALLNSEAEVQQTVLRARSRQLKTLGIGSLLLMGLLSMVIWLYSKIKNQNEVIAEALEDKDTLLKEIHHRVKNNLQVISALLTLQSKHVEDDHAVQALQEGQGRVQSMALIHQDLYQHDNLKGVNTTDYFEKLVDNLIHTYDTENRSIKVDSHIESMLLDVDTMIPLGLVVNELTSNALKHAFKDRKTGEIFISLSEDDNLLSLTIKDNGQGVDMSVLENKSFGYSLIKSFARRLDADLNISNQDGLVVQMVIKNYQRVA